MKKTNLPKRVYFPPDPGKSKGRWLKYGFDLLGVPTFQTATLAGETEESRIYPIELEFENKIVRIWFDIAASRTWKRLELLETVPDSLYFKVHMAKIDRKKDPRFFPFPQSVSSMQFVGLRESCLEQRMKQKFKYDVVACFVNSDDGLRQKVVERLLEMTDLRVLSFMIEHPKLERPKVPDAIIRPKLRYGVHLKSQARAKISLALPGAWRKGGASISFRHVEIWGIGGVVASIRPGTLMTGKPGKCWIEFKKDLSDFEKQIRYYVKNNEAREDLARRGAKYYRENHAPEKHALYLTKRVRDFFGADEL